MADNKRTTIVLSEWERNYLLSIIGGAWANQKVVLDNAKKRASEKPENTWNSFRLNDEILKFDLFESLLAKLVGREPNLEELIKEEVD